MEFTIHFGPLRRGPDPRKMTVQEYWAAKLREYEEAALAARGRSPEDVRLREGLQRYLEAQGGCPQCGKRRVRLATGSRLSGTGQEGEIEVRPNPVEPLDPEVHCTCWLEEVP